MLPEDPRNSFFGLLGEMEQMELQWKPVESSTIEFHGFN